MQIETDTLQRDAQLRTGAGAMKGLPVHLPSPAATVLLLSPLHPDVCPEGTLMLLVQTAFI